MVKIRMLRQVKRRRLRMARKLLRGGTQKRRRKAMELLRGETKKRLRKARAMRRVISTTPEQVMVTSYGHALLDFLR